MRAKEDAGFDDCDSDQEEQDFVDASEASEEVERGDGQPSDNDGVMGMVRSLSQRTLALVASPVTELVVMLVGIWAQALLILLSHGAETVSTRADRSSETTQTEAIDADADLKLSVDHGPQGAEVQACC